MNRHEPHDAVVASAVEGVAAPRKPSSTVERADIFVTVGTDHHEFARIVDWLDDWLGRHPENAPHTLLQHGFTKPSQRARNADFLAYPDVIAAMTQARVVITHGGPATIFEARAQGRLPLAVPRNPDLGEHVDHHQQRFTRRLSGEGIAMLAEDQATFDQLLDHMLANPDVATVHHDPAKLAPTIDHLHAVVEQVAPARELVRRRRAWRRAWMGKR